MARAETMGGTPCFLHDSYHPDCSDCWHDEPEPPSQDDIQRDLRNGAWGTVPDLGLADIDDGDA